MPIQIQFSPLLTSKATVDVSSLINSLRSQSKPESQRLADALEQLQSTIWMLVRALREGVSISGDRIEVTDANGAQGVVITSGAVGVNGLGVALTNGTGSPNGVVVGSPGGLYVDKAGGAGVTLYVKESGVGTDTGWVAK